MKKFYTKSFQSTPNDTQKQPRNLHLGNDQCAYLFSNTIYAPLHYLQVISASNACQLVYMKEYLLIIE